MRALTRKLLIPYLIASTLFAPLAPTFAQATHAAAVAEHQNLPELGGSKPSPAASSAKTDSALPADWQLRADMSSDLAPGVLRNRTQGIGDARSQGAGMLSSAATEASEAWLAKHKITSELNLKVDEKGLHGGSLDVLVPFYNASKSLAFVQGGIRRMDTYTDDYRNTVNLGVGYRQDVGNWMLGANTFFDRDLTGKNDRVGLGVEAWTDYLKLSANSYSPLSTWKASPDKTDFLERPAKGWDVRAEGYLPAYPQLGGKLAYEQYYGKNVSLFSADEQQKNPHAMTVGVIYNPIPLVSVGVDHRMGQGGLADTSANLTFNYRIGESFAKQVSSDSLIASHLLANMRYDLVSRNNEMVMDHRKAGAELRLPAVLSGTENKLVSFAITGAANVQSISWVGSAAAFAAPYDGSGQGSLTLPAYDSNSTNIYSLQAAGTDKSGRSVLSNVMTLEVMQTGLALNLSTASLPADGSSTVRLTAKLLDAQQPRARSAGARLISWSTSAGTLSSKTSALDANDEASVVLTSPTSTGTATVEASFGTVKRSATVTFTAGTASSLTVSAHPTAIEADGHSTSTLSATITDSHGNPVGAGISVNWSTDAGTLASATSTTNASGMASMVLTSSNATGTATVHASSGKANGSASVSFTAGAAAAIAITAAPAAIVADGSSTSTLSASVKDAHGNAVGAGVTVNWSTSAGHLASASSTTDSAGVASVELTSATTAGTATVKASAGNEHGSAMVTFTPGSASTLTVAAAPAAIAADGTSTSTLSATVKDAHGNVVGAGVTVNWSTSAGSLAAFTSSTNAQGIASIVLTSSTTTGDASVQAAVGSVKGSATVRFTAGAASTLSVSATPTSIVADGSSTSTLSTTVKDAHGNLVGAGVVVNWSTSAGSLDHASSSTNASGVATVVLTSATTAGDASVSATSGSASGAATVTFTAGSASALTVSATPSAIEADGSSTSTLSTTVKDAHGNLVGAGIVVNWSTTSGHLDQASSTTNASGVATVVLTSATTAGDASVTATSGAANGSSTVTFTPGSAATLTISASPGAIEANGVSTSTLSATVKDAHGNAVGAGVMVNWVTDAGSLARASSSTNASGVATVVLTSSTTAGDASVSATSGSASGSATVTFTPGAASALAVAASPASITANGSSTSTLSATLKDAHGNTVGAGVAVNWTTTAGNLDHASSTTNASGVATVVLTSATTAGDASVSATSGAANGSTTVTFTPGSAATLAISASPGAIEANGVSTSTLSTTVKDAHGNAVGAGVMVNWVTDAGSLAHASSSTNASGIATVELTSATLAGDATVRATAGAATATTTVTFTVGAPTTLVVSALPTVIEANGSSTSTLSTTVKDAHGNLVGAGVVVNWSTSAGSLDHASSSTNASGVATVVLTSSTTTGDASVSATSGSASGAATVTFTAGPASALTVSATPSAIEADGSSTSTLTTTVKDAHGNLVGAGVVVNWSTTSGHLDHASSTTNASGVATVVLTSATTAGDASVSATSGAANGSTTVTFTPGSAATLAISASPGAIEANGVSTSTLSATVKDAHGNAVGAGMMVNWVTDAGSLAHASSSTNASGVATVVLTSTTTTGDASVSATSGSASGSATVTFTAGPASALTLSATPSAIEADGSSTSTLSTTIKDAHGNLVGAGVVVNWSTSAGSLDHASSSTNASGVATAVLTSATTAGDASVSATSGAANGSTTVTFTPGSAATLAISASPSAIEANGVSTSTLSTTVKDAHGNLVGAGIVVNWSTTSGSLDQASSTTNASGVATVVLTSSTTAGDTSVSVTSGAATGSATVTFTAGSAATLAISASPSAIEANGVSTSTLSATVKDAHGNLVGAGVVVNWSTSAGSLDQGSSTTNASGVATVELTSATAVGDATVNATAGSASGSATVTFTPGAPSSVIVSATPTAIEANGTSTSSLSASIKDGNGNLVGAGVTVNWNTSSGSLANASSLTDASGVASVELTSSTSAGAATLQATAGAATGTTTVIFTPGAPATLTASATPTAIVADGVSTSTLSVSVKDTYGNPLGAGVLVNWSTDAGSLASASSSTDTNGMASMTLTSATKTGTANVQASSGSAAGAVAVTFKPGPISSLVVTADESAIFATGVDTTTVSVTARDAHGNLADAGETIQWSTSAGTLDATSSVTDANGVATTELTSAHALETAQVQATLGSVNGSTTVEFVDYVEKLVTVASKNSIVADGTSTSILTAKATGINGAPLAGEKIAWSTPNGTLSSASSFTDANGVATVVLTSSTKSGPVTITSRSVVSYVRGVAGVTFTPIPASITLVDYYSVQGTWVINAFVKDAAGNSVGLQTPVSWTSDGGSFDRTTDITDQNGRVLIVLTSTNAPETITVHITAGSVTKSLVVDFP